MYAFVSVEISFILCNKNADEVDIKVMYNRGKLFHKKITVVGKLKIK